MHFIFRRRCRWPSFTSLRKPLSSGKGYPSLVPRPSRARRSHPGLCVRAIGTMHAAISTLLLDTRACWASKAILTLYTTRSGSTSWPAKYFLCWKFFTSLNRTSRWSRDSLVQIYLRFRVQWYVLSLQNCGHSWTSSWMARHGWQDTSSP